MRLVFIDTSIFTGKIEMATRTCAERVAQLERQQKAQRKNFDSNEKETSVLSKRNAQLQATVGKLNELVDDLRSQLHSKDRRENETNAELRRLRYFRWQQESLVAFISGEQQKAGAKTHTQRALLEEQIRLPAETEVVEKLDAHARLQLLMLRRNVCVNRVFGVQRTLELMDIEEKTLQSYSNNAKLDKSPVKEMKQRLREIKTRRRILQVELEEADAEVDEIEMQMRNFQILAGKQEATDDELNLGDILTTQMQTLLDHMRIQQARQLKVCKTRGLCQ